MADVIVGRFALIDLIAQGGSGSVWRAWDAKAQRLCAAKVLRQRDSADLMRFVREKGVAFEHPHLLAPYGWGAEDEHVVIAMPLVSGGTLESIVRSRGPVAEPTAVVILDQLLDGLSLLHSHGWIHRDVKPANLMFEATGRQRPHTRLADFGIAVHETDVRFTHVGMINGTPGYLAPELFELAEPEPSHDIYAAGVVTLMALNGPLSLHDGAFTPHELAAGLRGVSPQLGSVLRRMLAARPADRYRDAASVRAALPRVPDTFPLSFADGSPFTADDTLAPLPADAPGAIRSPSMPVPTVPGSSAARSGGARSMSTGAPPRSPAPVAVMPASASSPSGFVSPSPASQAAAAGGLRQIAGASRAPSRRRTMLLAGAGLVLAVLAGITLAVVLLLLFSDRGSPVPGAAASPGATIVPVTRGKACTEAELGTVATLPDGTYISCARQDDGTYAYA